MSKKTKTPKPIEPIAWAYIGPSPEYCAACQLVLGSYGPDVTIPALREGGDRVAQVNQIHRDIVDGKRPDLAELVQKIRAEIVAEYGEDAVREHKPRPRAIAMLDEVCPG